MSEIARLRNALLDILSLCTTPKDWNREHGRFENYQASVLIKAMALAIEALREEEGDE